jgi:hypothetical protein
MSRGRVWHLATAALATFAVVFQLVLVWQGHAVLDETDPPSLGERLIRFIGYFTVLAKGYAAVSVACVGIAALFVGLAALAGKGDGRLARTR